MSISIWNTTKWEVVFERGAYRKLNIDLLPLILQLLQPHEQSIEVLVRHRVVLSIADIRRRPGHRRSLGHLGCLGIWGNALVRMGSS